MPLDTIPTSAELVEKYRELAHKCVFRAMCENRTIDHPEQYITEVAEIIDDVIDGAIRIATELEMDEMRRKVQELLNNP